MIRHLPAEDYHRLKAATRRLIKLCGGVEQAATVTRVEKSVLGDYASHDKMQFFIPADVAADLEAECGQTVVSKLLVELGGEGLRCGPIAEDQILPRTSALSVQLGKVHEANLEALRNDGRIDNGELDAIIREAETHMREATAYHDELCALREARRACARFEGRRGAAEWKPER